MLNSEEQLTQIAALIVGKTGTDKEVADELNAKTIMKYRSLTSSELNKWAAGNPGTRKTIFQASENYDSPYYDVCAAARFAMENTAEPLEMDDPIIRGMVAGLPIAQEAKDALLALAEAPISAAQEAGLPEIKEGYIQAARAL